MAKPSAQNFYDRLNQIAGTKKIVKENNDNSTLVDSQKSNEGTKYGIVKENHKYYIKKSSSMNESLDASDFVYISGIENRHEYEYNSLGEAEKQRNMYVKSLNEAFSLKPNNFIAETNKIKKVDDPFGFIKSRISEGKDFHKKKFENRLKTSLKKNVTAITNKKELIPEAADFAIKKALGLINEEESPLVTADSEEQASDVLPNMVNQKHEPAQAPINDTNAKSIADTNKGKQGTAAIVNNAEASPESDPFDDKENAGDEKSDIVSQADTTVNEWMLREAALSTADSEQSASDVLPNMVGKKHEPAQAPINDTNAKTIADKNDASGTPSAAIVNNVESSPESDPFTKKQNAGDQKGDIVSEKDTTAKITENEKKNGALTTADSEQQASDVLPNQHDKKESSQADVNDENAKTKADKNTASGTPSAALPNNVDKQPESDPFDDKENAGDEKGDIVSEKDTTAKITEAATTLEQFLNEEESPLVTADSEEQASDVLPNMVNKKHEPAQAPINDTNAKTIADTNKGKEGTAAIVNNAESSPESDPFDDKENAGDQKSDIVSQADTTVSEAADALGDLLGEGIEDVLDAQTDAVDSIPTEEPAPEVPAEPEMGADMGAEMPVADPMDGAEEMGAEMPTGGDPMAADPMSGDPMAADPMSGDPMDGAEEGGEAATDDVKNELKGKYGEANEIVRGIEFEDADIVELVNTALEPYNTEGLSHNDQLKIQNKLKGEEGDGEDLPPEIGAEEMGAEEVDAEIAPAMDAPEEEMEEAAVGGEEGCSECGPFDGYAKSRGYDDVSGAGGMELANLLSGYANAHGEGQNDGDFGNIIILLTPDVRTELQGYGQEDFLAKADEFGGGQEAGAEEMGAEEAPADEEKLSPGSFDIEVPSDEPEEENVDDVADAEITDDTNEAVNEFDAGMEFPKSSEEENINEIENIDELGWRDIKNVGAGLSSVGKKTGEKIGQKVGQAQQAVGGAIQKGVDYVGDKVKGAQQTYHQGGANRIVQDIKQDAAKLGQTINNYNTKAEKGGGQAVSLQSVMMAIKGQLGKGADAGSMDLSGAQGLSQFGEGGEDFATIAKDVDMGDNPSTLPTGDMEGAVNTPTFAPTAQNFGVRTPSMGTTKLGENEIKVRNYVKNRLEELAGKRKPTMNESEKPES